MRFALSPEQRDFAAALDELLAGADTPGVAREWAERRFEPGRKLWRELADLGVWGLLVPEEHGGADAEPADAVVALEACGYHAVPGPVVETTVVAPRLLGGDELARVAAGESMVTAAIPPEVPRALDADAADVVLRLDGTAVQRISSDMDSGGRMPSIDATRGLFPAAEHGEVLGAARPHAFALGVLGVSAQLLGAARRMLAMATEYASQRRQYGRAIGQYQAVKHLLADVTVSLTMARPLVDGAAVTLASGAAEPVVMRDISAAKVAATRAALLAARTSLQVHGAIGYTAEHDLGLWLTKVRALAGAWGTADAHRTRVLTAVRGEHAD
ncbi:MULTISPECIES: acyl-CoA dehydrogenase family protein [Prauserella salsuginis group]|uniref:Acyl-CoA dehydrogenase n=2 Tax=Prauserella salsuginis group TaxID=2893672 RepID=A0A839Y2A1_9PSEU|nr:MULTISPECIES: acyl-CoA dehydrogenase family protein [Prauserella salsuginis group]MBB3666035.1 hypothetical protein [Prauserella sediminis]MCR3718927.1 hypothetical protein [Prauserella flava]MCR3733497.1 hypothetical protein [Prauserella salsuginis]